MERSCGRYVLGPNGCTWWSTVARVIWRGALHTSRCPYACGASTADGSSPLPIATFLADLDRLPKSLNIGTFIGQGSVRSAVIGDVDRRATPDEIARMQAVAHLMTLSAEADVFQGPSFLPRMNPIGKNSLIGAAELAGTGEHAAAIDEDR